MTKQLVITKTVNPATNFTQAREFCSVKVDDKVLNIGIMPNKPVVDVVEASLRKLKEVAVINEEEAFDVNITTPVALGATVTGYLTAKYELEPQFSSVTFS